MAFTTVPKDTGRLDKINTALNKGGRTWQKK